MLPKLPKICSGVGAIASVMSKFVHLRKQICDNNPNRPKNHKLQGFVLVVVDAKVVRKGANEILVFVFIHFDFPGQQLYSAKRYIHVNEEGEDDSLFFLVESVIPTVSAGGIVKVFSPQKANLR